MLWCWMGILDCTKIQKKIKKAKGVARFLVNRWIIFFLKEARSGFYIGVNFLPYGKNIVVQADLYLYMGLFVIISVWSNVFSYFVNAIGALRVQTITAIIAAMINIPLSIYFAKNLQMGLSGIMLGTISSLSIFSVCGAIQVYLIIIKNKKTSYA